MIRVDDLAVSYDGRRVVSDVAFAVGRGQAFGLVGESGSGKSSVLRAMLGLAGDAHGRITIDETDVSRLRCGQGARRRLQMVFQDPYGSLHPNHRVERVLGEAVDIAGLDRREERIVEALSVVGLGEAFMRRYPHQMSGGQRQRLAIARALIVEPGAILLDEPTSALDVSVRAEILNLLMRLRRERGIAMVMVSHDLAIVGWFCDQVAVMRNGRIVEVLTPEDLAAGRAREPYTAELIGASRGYRRRA